MRVHQVEKWVYRLKRRRSSGELNSLTRTPYRTSKDNEKEHLEKLK